MELLDKLAYFPVLRLLHKSSNILPGGKKMVRTVVATLMGASAIVGLSGTAQARTAQESGYTCSTMIAEVEQRRKIPRGLLMAIAITESGNGGQPSPYAMNIAGRSHFADSKAEMAKIISANWSRGVKSIDVGCMQVNLKYHGQKFGRLTDLLDSQTNVEYGAGYLIKLAHDRGSWREGVMDYHNKKVKRRRNWYGCKVWNNYLRITHARTGFVQCPKTPTGSSVASRDSIKTTPLVIPGYNDSRATLAAVQSGMNRQPAMGGPAQALSANVTQVPTGSPLDPGITSAPANIIRAAAAEPVHPQKQRERVMGTIELASAEESLADVTTSSDPRASAFQSVRPQDWSERQRAVASAEAPGATSNTQGGFARIGSD